MRGQCNLNTAATGFSSPEFDMMALTSAKSTLIRPGTVMMSEMPCTEAQALMMAIVRLLAGNCTFTWVNMRWNSSTMWVPARHNPNSNAVCRIVVITDDLKASNPWLVLWSMLCSAPLPHLHTLAQHIICQAKCILQGSPLTGHIQQLVIGDDND
jgi:hypothetical protein